MIKYANIDDARFAVEHWSGDPQSVERLGDFGNSVFSFKNQDGKLQILRFTDPEFRSFEEVLAELSFVNHLYNDGVPAANAIPNTDGQLAVQIPCSPGVLICSSVSYARGIEVQEGSPHWTEDFFQEWGCNLALIHESSSRFIPSSGTHERWQWQNEILIQRAKQLIPKGDGKSLEEFNEVMDRCMALPMNPGEFGLTHADHAPQNFRYDLVTKKITAFDFGNCCYHWFVSDLAISLSTVRRKPNREQIKENILKGYSRVRVLPDNYEELIDLFIRLRVLYVYLSRLHLWSVNRTLKQQRDLDLLQSRVHAKIGWGKPVFSPNPF